MEVVDLECCGVVRRLLVIYLYLWIIFIYIFILSQYTFFFFFFQADDGIRDRTVTGVQTCALPIWPRQIPKIGFLPIKSRRASCAYGIAAGSPGPFERKIPSGLSASTSSAVVDAGTTVTPKPFCRRRRKMFSLMP